MRKAVASKKVFAVAALLFTAASLMGRNGGSTVGGTSLIVAAGSEKVTMQSGPTMPPGPWEEGKLL